MKKLYHYIVMTILLCGLQACGLKGDLYTDGPEDNSTSTAEPLPPMSELETSFDETGTGVAEDMESIDGLASPDDETEGEDDDVLGDAPIAP
jgi:predicted small lipoprotein YifL